MDVSRPNPVLMRHENFLTSSLRNFASYLAFFEVNLCVNRKGRKDLAKGRKVNCTRTPNLGFLPNIFSDCTLPILLYCRPLSLRAVLAR